MKYILIALLAILSLSACTDAATGKWASLGSSAKVECWSGDTKIYSGRSTGKVASEAQSDGYFFRDKKTDQMLEVSGNCIIIYD